MPNNKKIDSIPRHFKSVADAGDFWDAHDVTDYWDQTHEVKGRINVKRKTVLTALEPDLFKKLMACAKQKGVSTGTLINVWLAERVSCDTRAK
jgi:hypothetical protein